VRASVREDSPARTFAFAGWAPTVAGMPKHMLLVAIVLAGTLSFAAPAQADFGRLFPSLPGLTDQTPQQLADLANTQLDPNATTGDNLAVPSGFTYGGQFVDHDLTSDLTPQPFAPVNPVGIPNARTFRLDLDSLYGSGPASSPQIYEADRTHLRVTRSNANGVPDLARNPDGSAILVEPRNDENEIISQIHTAFALAHNKLIDSGRTFAQAQAALISTWQHIVLDQYLPAVLGQAATSAAVNKPRGQLIYKPGNPNNPMTPVEFSVAAFRFGHSEVRRAYEVNEGTGKIQVFSFTLPDLRGGRPLPGDRQIAWGNFFNALTDPDDADGVNRRSSDLTLISSSLFALPIPGAEASGSNVLAFRNMLRAKFYAMPSYESVARQLGVTPVGAPVFPAGTPLWYGILRESEQATGGLEVGPVGARIIAETIVGVLEADKDSILRKKVPVDLTISPDGQPTFENLLVFAGLATRP
jgi:hypothetical protein